MEYQSREYVQKMSKKPDKAPGALQIPRQVCFRLSFLAQDSGFDIGSSNYPVLSLNFTDV